MTDKKNRFDSITGAETPIPVEEVDDDNLQGDNKALAIYREEEFSAVDLLLPRIRLAQGLTPEVQDGTAKPGQILLTGYDPVEEVVFIPMGMRRRRVLRDEDERTAILCSSDDGKNGQGVPGGACQLCPLSAWTDEDDKRRPPKCMFSYNFLAFSVTHQTLAAITFQNTGIRTGKLLNTMIAQRGYGKFAVLMKGVGQRGPSGAFHVPSISPKAVDPADLEKALVRAQLGY